MDFYLKYFLTLKTQQEENKLLNLKMSKELKYSSQQILEQNTSL